MLSLSKCERKGIIGSITGVPLLQSVVVAHQMQIGNQRTNILNLEDNETSKCCPAALLEMETSVADNEEDEEEDC
jgi:hypothetical protein